jgi:hypothetical protein
MARSGRRIEPFIGFALYDDYGRPALGPDGKQAEVYAPKGVYWSRDWSMPEQGTGASASALDRLGLLREAEYNGIGNIDDPEAAAEDTWWNGASLYDVAANVLEDLQANYMEDLEFSIDEGLREVTVPYAFFARQSYFDVIKTIAQAGLAYAFMDTPEPEEIAAAAARGNTSCADILRIIRLENFTGGGLPDGAAETLAKRDYITKNPVVRRDDVANDVTVPYTAYVIQGGKPQKAGGDPPPRVTVSDPGSILEHGRIRYEFPENTLVQTEERAGEIAAAILAAFAGAPRTAEIETFGDVTRRVGDILEVPEYQKRGIDARGLYAVTRLSTDFGDGLRQGVTCRLLDEKAQEDDWDIIDERPDTDEFFDERGNNDLIIEEGVAA